LRAPQRLKGVIAAKVYLLQQRVQLLKEGVPQDDIDSTLPLVND